MGRLHAAGIFACVNAAACVFGNCSWLDNEASKESPKSKARRIVRV
jgi:hypothetical protein